MRAAATRLGEGFLESARSCGSLEEALAPYPVTVGATARAGAERGIPVSPRAAARELLRPTEGGGPPPPAALVFGTERDGLTNEDLRLCSLVVTIPTESPETSSLNLAQAVLVLGYELLLAAGAEPPPPLPQQPAPSADVARASADRERRLYETGFLPERDPGRWYMNVKKILRRSGLTRGECDLIQGVCRQIRWAVRNGPPPSRAPWPGAKEPDCGGHDGDGADRGGPQGAGTAPPACGGSADGEDGEDGEDGRGSAPEVGDVPPARDGPPPREG
jgi:tRNA/rRNA methyltransferase